MNRNWFTIRLEVIIIRVISPSSPIAKVSQISWALLDSLSLYYNQ